jgi:hypothetical protein
LTAPRNLHPSRPSTCPSGELEVKNYNNSKRLHQIFESLRARHFGTECQPLFQALGAPEVEHFLPTLPQTTARDPDKDELTALKEQKTECGAKANRPMPAVVTQGQARVRGFGPGARHHTLEPGS